MASWSYSGSASQQIHHTSVGHPGYFMPAHQSSHQSIPMSAPVHAPTPMHGKPGVPNPFDMMNLRSAMPIPTYSYHIGNQTVPGMAQWGMHATPAAWPAVIPLVSLHSSASAPPNVPIHTQLPNTAFATRTPMPAPTMFNQPSWSAPWPANMRQPFFAPASSDVDMPMPPRSPSPDLTDASSVTSSGSNSSPTIRSLEPEEPRPKMVQPSSPATTPFTWSLSLSPLQPAPVAKAAVAPAPAAVRKVTFRNYVDVACTYHPDDYDRTSIEVEPLTMQDIAQIQSDRQLAAMALQG
ncbi:hypothetical protein BJ742DRAFT_197887 [Cladochytrium replicatum]|nr:hypothetical protein BJ742DRAFT_197887 [Cladochytrium replicatum]